MPKPKRARKARITRRKLARQARPLAYTKPDVRLDRRGSKDDGGHGRCSADGRLYMDIAKRKDSRRKGTLAVGTSGSARGMATLTNLHNDIAIHFNQEIYAAVFSPPTRWEPSIWATHIAVLV